MTEQEKLQRFMSGWARGAALKAPHDDRVNDLDYMRGHTTGMQARRAAEDVERAKLGFVDEDDTDAPVRVRDTPVPPRAPEVTEVQVQKIDEHFRRPRIVPHAPSSPTDLHQPYRSGDPMIDAFNVIRAQYTNTK